MDERENKIKYRQAFSRFAVPEDMTDRIMNALDEAGNTGRESGDQEVSGVVMPIKRTGRKQSSKRRYRVVMSAAAACAAAAVGLFAVNGPVNSGPDDLITGDDKAVISDIDIGAAHSPVKSEGEAPNADATDSIQQNTNSYSSDSYEPVQSGNAPRGGSGAAAAGTGAAVTADKDTIQPGEAVSSDDARDHGGAGADAEDDTRNTGRNVQAEQPFVVNDDELFRFEEEFIRSSTDKYEGTAAGERAADSKAAVIADDSGNTGLNAGDDTGLTDRIDRIDRTDPGDTDGQESGLNAGVIKTLSPSSSVIRVGDVNKLSDYLDFSPVLPDKTEPGWTVNAADVIFGVVQIMYEDARGSIITYRTAKTTEDISGNTAEYPETKMRGSFKFGQKNDDEVNLVTWTDGNYSYSLSFMPPVNTESAYHWARSIERAASAAG